MSDHWDDKVEQTVTLKLRREVTEALAHMARDTGMSLPEIVTMLVEDAIGEERATDFLLAFEVPPVAEEDDAVTADQTGCGGWVVALQEGGAIVRIVHGWDGPCAGEMLVATGWDARIVSVFPLGRTQQPESDEA